MATVPYTVNQTRGAYPNPTPPLPSTLPTAAPQKYHICKQHGKAGCVVMEGRAQRFCQKVS